MSDTAVVEETTTTLLTDAATSVETPTTATPEATAADPAAPADAPVAPVYEFVAPDGVTYDEALLAEAVPLFTEANVSPEMAQKLVGVVATRMAAIDTARAEAFTQQVQGWADATKADPEMGGAKLPATIAQAQRAIHRFGGDGVKALLNETGLGSHPEFVRFFAKIGAATAEDTVIQSSSGGAPVAQSPGSVLFPTMKAKE